jgi:hypothetical protein
MLLFPVQARPIGPIDHSHHTTALFLDSAIMRDSLAVTGTLNLSLLKMGKLET